MKLIGALLLFLASTLWGQDSTYSEIAPVYYTISDSIPGNNSFNQSKDLEEYNENVYLLVVANAELAIFSYTKEGKINSSFATNGKFTLSYGYSPNEARIAIDGNGNIYIGTFNGIVLEIRKINQNGTLDNSFGQSGGVFSYSIAFAGTILDMYFQGGKVIVGGFSSSSFFVIKLNTSGTLDTSFDSDGYAGTTFANDSPNLYGITLTPQGDIYMTGYINYFVSGINPVIIKFTKSGIATNFGIGGILNVSSTSTFRNIKEYNGNLYVCGYKSSGDSQAMLCAYNSNGNLINSFGTQGDTLLGRAGSYYEYFHDLIITPNEEIIAAGFQMYIMTYDNNAFLGKFDLNGNYLPGASSAKGLSIGSKNKYESITFIRSFEDQHFFAGTKANKFLLVIAGQYFPKDGIPDFPTGFSPNDDGKNDFLEIKDLDFATEKRLKVFDREGNLVYSNDNYNNDWNGVNNEGKPLADGTYYYHFKYAKSKEIKKYIEIRRK